MNRSNPSRAASGLGNRLRELRQRCRRYDTQEAFAAAAGLTARSLRRIESGHRLPATDTLNAILATVGATPDEAAQVRQLHAQLMAGRMGVGVAERDHHQLARLEQRLVTAAVLTLRRCGFAINDTHQRRLGEALGQVLHAVLAGEPRNGTQKNSQDEVRGETGGPDLACDAPTSVHGYPPPS